jgi:hypothetical protein
MSTATATSNTVRLAQFLQDYLHTVSAAAQRDIKSASSYEEEVLIAAIGIEANRCRLRLHQIMEARA